MSRAETEWEKFTAVEELLKSVNEYMAIYQRLLENGELIIIGSKGDQKPSHEVPLEHKKAWKSMSAAQQLEITEAISRDTLNDLNDLCEKISLKWGLEAKSGPLKGRERVIQKRDSDYNGDVRRVIDFVRCSSILVIEHLEQAVEIVNAFEEGGCFAEEWSFVRTKDGFEKPDNFIVGGYRDIKLNVRCKRNGHVVEIQLHLRPYYELKNTGGHAHYEFARNLKVDAVTNAVSILDCSDETLMEEICDVGESRLASATDPTDRYKTARQLGDLYAARWMHGKKAILKFDEALRLVEEVHPEDCLDTCEVLTSLAYCVSEMQRHRDRDNMQSVDPKWMTIDNRPWIERAVAVATRLMGPRHPFSLKAKRVMADVINEHDDVEGANTLYHEVLKDQNEVLGGSHPDTIETLNNLGDFASEKLGETTEQLQRAIGYYMQGLEGAVLRMGWSHPTTDMLISNIEATYEDFPELPNAEEEMRSLAQRIREGKRREKREQRGGGDDGDNDSSSSSSNSSDSGDSGSSDDEEE